MKRFILVACVLLLAIPMYAQDFSKIKMDMNRNDVYKAVGNPIKKILGKDPTTDCAVWVIKDKIWLLFFKDGKSMGEAQLLDDMVKGLLDLASILSETSPQDGAPPGGVTKDSGAEKPTNFNTDKVKSDILVEVIEAKSFKSWSDDLVAGVRLKIKNNSKETIYKLEITVYYYDRSGNVFFEDKMTPVNSESWTDPTILKPNYSLVYPSEAGTFATASGIDLDEWDEGKVSIEITELQL